MSDQQAEGQEKMVLEIPGQAPKPPEEGQDAATEKKAPFSAKWSGPILEMRIDLRPCVIDENSFYLMRGYVLSLLDQAMGMVLDQRAQLAKNKVQIVKGQSAGVMRQFLNRIIK